MIRIFTLIVASVIFHTSSASSIAEKNLSDEAREALDKAVSYFRENVSTEGGYLWRYSEDLAQREGEGKASATTVWVQPPGTPSLGGAFLRAYEATGDPSYLEAAKETAMALVRGQLESGGWDYRIEFDPEVRKRYAYRVDGNRDAPRNVTTLDDNTTQSALGYLMRVDRVLEFKDEAIHEAVEYALDKLLEAQYPSGAWPQRFSEPPDPELHPVKKASYPESWSRKYKKVDYRGYYTFNDDTISDMVLTMLDAGAIYGESRYRKAAEKAGGFILLAQMPDPQPAWAQQYDADMHPAWARKFEPPGVTGGESHGVIRTLMTLYRATGDSKYLEPIPRALDYLRGSRLGGGGLARFYELETNRPLFFTKTYELTYDDGDLPTHYGFKLGDWIEDVAAQYEEIAKQPKNTLAYRVDPDKPKWRSDREDSVRETIAALDERGRWVEKDRLRYQDEGDTSDRILNCGTFTRNVGILCDYLLSPSIR